MRRGIIEPVIELEKADKIHYLPHHAVIYRETKTTKIRVVYLLGNLKCYLHGYDDASQKAYCTVV